VRLFIPRTASRFLVTGRPDGVLNTSKSRASVPMRATELQYSWRQSTCAPLARC